MIKILLTSLAFFFLNSNLLSGQTIINHPVLFDDFIYNSIEFPAQLDSSGSIFGKNPWVTNDGVIYTTAWRRYNRDNHEFGANAEIVLENYGFSLKMNKGYKNTETGPLIVSGFYFNQGTFAARVRFNKLKFDTQFIQAFWLVSPLYFCFKRGNEEIRYWSEIDFEFNNYFTGYNVNTIQIGCNNENGRSPISKTIDCIAQENNSYKSFVRCEGPFQENPLTSDKWYILLFNLDSSSRTVKFSMLSNEIENSGLKIWGGASPCIEDWSKAFVITDYFPEYALTVDFSLHLGSKSTIAKSNNEMNVDWFYYSSNTDLSIEDVKKDIDSLRESGIERINTTGEPTFNEALSEEPGIIYIEGPDEINSCEENTWKLKSNYKRHASFEMDFRYRFHNSEGYEEWNRVFYPSLKLIAREHHDFLEIVSTAYNYWGNYTTNDSVFIPVSMKNCLIQESKPFIIYEPYPNPSLLSVQLDYELLKPATVKVNIYDILGRKIRTLVEDCQDRGNYSVIFDAISEISETYICVYNINSEIITKKIMIFKE
jgi:hypothetical protein